MSSSKPVQRSRSPRYELLGELARGGMGVVFRAVDSLASREVAYKRLLVPPGATRARIVALFEREYDTLAKLRHPNIVEVYDYGFDDEGPFYVMELLTGENLFGVKVLPVERACAIVYDVASALTLIHARRLVHRDVTPKNVYVEPSGRAKLIDFGALTSFGVPHELVGTAPFVAPECLRDAPLDGRSDLFSLGALAYQLLVGQRAISATTLEQRQREPEPAIVDLSQRDPALPRELCTLVMSLLSGDPLARPSDAAEVMQRLAAIADLPEASDERAIAYSFLAHPPLSGRSEELNSASASLRQGMTGSVQILSVEGESGLGRSALLDQLAIESQLRGATVLRAHGDAFSRPFDVAHALVRTCEALQSESSRDPDEHATDRPPRAQAVGAPSTFRPPRAAPALPTPLDAAASHALQVDALLGVLLAHCRDSPTVVLVDDADLADTESLAVLAALSHRASDAALVIALAVRRGDAVRGSAFALLGTHATRISLRPLDLPDTARLVESLFGQLVNTQRVARWLYEHGGGNPASTMRLLRGLLDDGLLKYERGRFLLPHDLPANAIGGAEAEDALRTIAGLEPHALELAQVLCLQQERLPLELLCAATDLDTKHTMRLVDRLCARGIARISEGHSWIAGDALRRALEATMDEAEKRACHLRVALRWLERGYGSGDESVVVAANLLRGGDEAAGQEIMTRAIETGGWATSTVIGSTAAVPLLEELLAQRRARGYSDEQNLSLLTPLAAAGYFASYRKQVEHGDRALAALVSVSGLRLAKKLERFVGSWLALGIGVSYGFLRHMLTPRAERMASFRATFTSLMRAMAGSVASAVSAFDARKAFDILEQFSFFARFPVNGGARVTYEFALGTAEVGAGRNLEASRRYADLARVLERGQISFYTPGDMHTMTLASLLGRAQAELSKGTPETLALAEELRLGHPFYAASAESVCMGYFAYRGQQDVADRYRTVAELAALRNGMSWASVTTLIVRSSYAYALTRNTTGLAESIAELDRLSESIPNLTLFRDGARAYQALLDGRPDEAAACYEALLRDPRHAWTPTVFLDRTFYAQALRVAGRAREAKQVCLSILSENRARLLGDQRRHLPTQELALAEAELGEFEPARTRLDASLSEFASSSPASPSPLLKGSLHRDRALVALLEGDRDAFANHLAAMGECFDSTRNPWLVRQREQLEIQGRQRGMNCSLPVGATARTKGSAWQGETTDLQAKTDLSETASDSATAFERTGRRY